MEIHALRDWLKMGRVDAVADAAQVVEPQPLRYWADEHLIGKAVSPHPSLTEVELAIAVGRDTRSPQPAPAWPVLVDP